MGGIPFDELRRRGCTNLTGKSENGVLLYCGAPSLPGVRTPRCAGCADGTFGAGWEQRQKDAAEKAVKKLGPMRGRAKKTVMSRNWG